MSGVLCVSMGLVSSGCSREPEPPVNNEVSQALSELLYGEYGVLYLAAQSQQFKKKYETTQHDSLLSSNVVEINQIFDVVNRKNYDIEKINLDDFYNPWENYEFQDMNENKYWANAYRLDSSDKFMKKCDELKNTPGLDTREIELLGNLRMMEETNLMIISSICKDGRKEYCIKKKPVL